MMANAIETDINEANHRNGFAIVEQFQICHKYKTKSSRLKMFNTFSYHILSKWQIIVCMHFMLILKFDMNILLEIA